MNSNFTHLNSKLRITKLLRSSSGTLRKSALSLSLFILFTLFNTNNILAQCNVIVTQPSITFTIDLDGAGTATIDGTTPQVSANISPVSDPPCDTYVFYESDGTTYIGTSISLDCTDEGVQTTYVVRIAEDGIPTNPSLDFLTINVTPLDNELPTWLTPPGVLDMIAFECDLVDAYVVDILAIPLLVAIDNCTPVPTISVVSDVITPGFCPNTYIRTIMYTAFDDVGNEVAAPYTVVLDVVDTTPPDWLSPPGSLDVVLECNDAAGLTAAQALVPVPIDNCSAEMDMTVMKTPGPLVPGPCGTMTGTILNVFDVMDECGNPSPPFFQVITIIDTQAPTSTQADITVSALDPPDCNMFVSLTLTPGNTSDECDPFGLLMITNDALGLIGAGNGLDDASGVYPLGTTTITFSLTDDCGNNSLHMVDVIVEDNSPPVITYMNIVHMMNTTAGDCSNIFGWTRPFDGPPDAFDCSGPLTVTETITGPDPSAIFGAIGPYVPGTAVIADFPVGITTITYTFEDTEGNSDTRSVTVTVIDNEDPVAICQDITVQLDASGDVTITPGDVDNGSNDNCSGVILSFNNFAPNPGPVYCSDAQGTPGYPSDFACETAICTADPFCCAVVWDGICAAATVIEPACCGCVEFPDPITCGIPGTTSLDFDCLNVGPNLVTLFVEDTLNNSASCLATVTVEDNVPPIALCQNITVQLDASGNASIVAAQIDNGSTDNCGIASLMIDVTSFDCNDVGANNVNLTVTDVNGNVSMCAALATVEDNVAPAALCQDITVQLDAFGNASITAAQVDNGSNDACGIASLSVSPNTFTCGDVGANNVTLTVTDNNGNVSTCSPTVTVEDNVAPIALCQDITVQLDGSNMASIVGADVDNGSNDACGIGSLSVAPNSFDCSNVGNNTVTLTVTDNNGNMATCMATVTVEDIVPPTIACPSATIIIPDNTSETITGPFGIPDICPSPGFLEESIAISVPAGATITDFDISLEITHTWVGDLSAQIESPSGTIISFFHRPGTTSTGICSSINGFGCSGDNMIATFDDEAGNTYNDFENTCDPGDPAIGGSFMPQSPFSSFDGEDPNGTWLIRIQDNAGADDGDLDLATLDIEYDYPQVGNDLERNTDPGSCDYTAVGTEFDPLMWDDNCSGSVITHNYPLAPNPNTLDGAVFPVGQTNITWTVTDASGNTATCNMAVLVTDNELPTQTGGQGDGTTITAVAIGCTAVVGWTEPTFTDNCPPVTVVSNFTPPFSFPVGTTTVVYTATDANNNSTVVSFDIEVSDGTPPVAGCQPLQIDKFLDGSGLVTLTASEVNLGSMDNCGNITLLISVLGSPFVPSYTFNCTELGVHTVTLQVSDGLLTDECTTTVGVFDNIFPTAACKDITISLDAFGNASINPTQVDNGSTDNGLLCLSLSINQSNFNCGDIGDNTVTLTATDAAGNTDQCISTVTVEDNLAPNLFGIPADITISCLNPIPNPPVIGPGGVTANDNCDVPVIIFNETSTKSGNPNNCLNYAYVITRTWTASDNSSNTSMQSQTITIVDNSVPINAVYNAPSVGNGGTVSTNPNDCFATITLQMTGLSDCAPFANITVTNDAPHGNGMTNASGNYAIGVYSITFTATDPCGNTSMFNYSFEVFDGVAPVASCVNNLNLGLPSSGTLILSPGAVNNGSYDNCNGTSGIANLSVSPNVFDCDDVGGPHTVTLTVTDFAGNSSTCITTVNIQENNAPIALCQPTSLTLGPNGTVSLNASQVDAGSFDDCTPVTLSVFPNSFDETDLGNNVVTLTVTDDHGNSSTCQALVTILLPPTCFNIGTVAGGAGNVVSVPVTVEDFTGIVGFQFHLQIMSDADSINWDSIGEFVGVSGIHADLNNLLEFNLCADTVFTPIDTTYSDVLDGMGNPIDGILDSIDVITFDTTLFYNNMSVSWLQFNPAGPISLIDGTVVFFIDILLTGNLNDFSVVKIVNPSIKTPPEVTHSFGNQLFNVIPCWDNGAIFIGELVIAGNIQTENGDNVALANVNLFNTGTNFPVIASDQTGLDGNYSFTIVSGGSFDIDPSKNINWFNGIDILDVAGIQQHAVNFAYVDSPYKKIAADVNGSNTITTFDAVQLNLYLSSGFLLPPPPGPSWRFADAKEMLPNLPNANVPPYTDELTILNIISDTLMNNFIGIKTGDIAGLMADPTNLTGDGAEELSDTDLKFLIENKSIKENESVRIDLKAENFDKLIGYQWILQFDPEVLRYQDYDQGSLENLGDGNFGEILAEEGKLIMTWYNAYPTDIDSKEVLFTLNFEAKQSANRMSDILSITELVQFAPVAYNGEYDSREIELVFVDVEKVDGEFALYQNIPNPFKDETVISFNLPEKTYATLIITDIAGRVLKKVEGDFGKGYNEVNISRSDLPQSGTLFYELITEDNTATKQMIVIE